MLQESHIFFNLMVVVGLALLVPIILSRQKKIRLPIIVGEIIAGIIIGKSGFQLIWANDPILEFLAEFGLIYLMFLSGIEIDFGAMLAKSSPASKKVEGAKNSELSAPLLGLLVFIVTFLLSIGLAFLLKNLLSLKSPWMMALILSTTSLGVVVPVLKESNIINSKFGQSILVSAFIADFATMLFITTYISILSKGLSLEIFLVAILFGIFFFLYRFGVFVNKVPILQKSLNELSHATAQIKIRGAFALILVFIVFSEILGTEVILGAFLAGVIIALIKTPNDSHIIQQLEAFGFGLLIPIFFINIGININLKSLIGSPLAMALFPILLIGAYLIKLIATGLFNFNFSFKKSIAAGFLMSSRLSLIIAASAIGLRMGLISDAVNTTIILVAIFSVTVSPVVFMRLTKKLSEKVEYPIIIVGANELGLQVATQMKSHNEPILIIDDNIECINRAKMKKFNILKVNFNKNDSEFSRILEGSKLLICTISDSELNFNLCNIAKNQFNVERVISYIENTADLYRYEQIGIETMNAAIDRAVFLALIARNPAMYSLLTRVDDDKELSEISVLNPEFHNKKIRNIILPGDILILALRRDGELIVPHGNTEILPGDHLTIAGSIDFFEESKLLLENYT